MRHSYKDDIDYDLIDLETDIKICEDNINVFKVEMIDCVKFYMQEIRYLKIKIKNNKDILKNGR